jgi:hypothetical protein
MTTAPGFLYLFLFTDFPLYWTFEILFLFGFYGLMFVTYWTTSGKDPIAEPTTESKYLDPFLTSSSEVTNYYEENLTFIDESIKKFYENYNLIVRDTNLEYIRWWIETPLRFEVTTGFLKLPHEQIKKILFQQLSNIPFHRIRRWNISVAIVFLITSLPAAILGYPDPIRFIRYSPSIYYFSTSFYLFLLLKYFLIVLVPILLVRVPTYIKLYKGEEYMYEKLGDEEWKAYRKEFLDQIDTDLSIFAKWFLPTPTYIQIVKHIMKKYDIKNL